MSIVRCTAYPFRYAEEAYAESADEADALELFEHYRGYITGREDYELVGVYGDHGKSGRKMDGRPELGRLLTDCEAGRIDLILTKSTGIFRSIRAQAFSIWAQVFFVISGRETC